jgi:hypothetical protein
VESGGTTKPLWHSRKELIDGRNEERIRRFGHPEHVRLYGPDIAERLRASGFAVEIVRSDMYVFEQTEYQWSTLGLLPQNIYICR